MVRHAHFGRHHEHREHDDTDGIGQRYQEPNCGTHRCEVGGDVQRVGRGEQEHRADENPAGEPLADQRAETLAGDKTQSCGCFLNAGGEGQQRRRHPEQGQTLRRADL